MSPRYASETSVSAEQSCAEIERTLARYGADAFIYGYEGRRAAIKFRIAGRQVRFDMEMPDPASPAFTEYMRGSCRYRRAESESRAKWEQACRQLWRALALVIKAKLEATAAGITTIEDEFLAHTLLADGRTVGETIRPQLEEHYRLGGPPGLMLEGPRT